MAAPARIIQVAAECSFKIKKLKVRKGQDISKGTLLCLYTTDTPAVQKFKSCHGGTINNIHVKEGQDVEIGDVMFTLEGCTHPTVMKDMCASCGVDLRLENSTAGNRKEGVTASVAMVHSIPELIVSEQMAQELGKADQDRLLSSRKLVLLVDLDQTIIHTTMDNVPANLKGVKHFQLWHGNQMSWHHTKFRPGTLKFLEEISKLYELHICTFGSRMYAHTIAKIIDPEGKFFSYRILSRDECFDATLKTANLKALFPCGDAMVCIIDDREDVWNFVPNMVHVKPYKFFEGTADINAPPGLAKSSEDYKLDTNKTTKTKESIISEQKEISQSHKIEEGKGDSLEKVAENEINSEQLSESQDAVPGNEIVKTKAEQNATDNSDKAVPVKDESEEMETCDKVVSEADNKATASPIRDTSEERDACVNPTSVDSQENITEDKNQRGSTTSEVKYQDSTTVSNINGKDNKGSKGDCISVDKEASNEDKENILKDDDTTSTNIVKTEANELSDRDRDEKEGKSHTKSSEAGAVKDKDSKLDKENETNPDNENTADKDSEEIEWDDGDDYLFYLEDVLRNIHKAFYDMHDQMKEKNPDDLKTNPSLKDIIPYIKKKILKDCNIVFSGIIPTNMQLEKNRAYIMAVSLGANVQNEIKDSSNEKDSKDHTTHLIAARDGTSKVRTAIKSKCIKIVNLKWLWSCYERWEKVEESLFLDISSGKPSDDGRDSPDPSKLAITKKRKGETTEGMNASKKAKTSEDKDNAADNEDDASNGDVAMDLSNSSTSKDVSNEESKSDKFSSTYNPLYAFSDDDIAFMDKEVEEEIDDDEESSEEEDARNDRLRKQVLTITRPEAAESSSEDSMTGDMPRGWGLKEKMSPKWSSSDEDEKKSSPRELGPEYESETDQDKFEGIMDAFGPVTSSDDDYQESIGSVDDEMADAVMKEFMS